MTNHPPRAWQIKFGMFEGSIVGHRRKDGILEYRVHWDGKLPDEDDWFPRNQLIEEYPGKPVASLTISLSFTSRHSESLASFHFTSQSHSTSSQVSLRQLRSAGGQRLASAATSTPQPAGTDLTLAPHLDVVVDYERLNPV